MWKIKVTIWGLLCYIASGVTQISLYDVSAYYNTYYMAR